VITRVLPEPLTQREMTILHFLGTSMSIMEIADELCLSVNTVKTHIAAIYRKLPASRRREAVLRARELELI
jgi:LuxR family maltose regulon positive regulatory protein